VYDEDYQEGEGVVQGEMNSGMEVSGKDRRSLILLKRGK